MTDQVLADLPYSRAHIEEPSNFIDWNCLATIMDRSLEHFSEDEILDIAVSSFRHPLYVIYRAIGRLRFTLPQFLIYLLGPEGRATSFYPMQSETLNYDQTRGSLVFRLTLRSGLRTCKPFFKILEGQAIGIPETMGY